MSTTRTGSTEGWPRTIAGARSRMKECESNAENARGVFINAQWYFWMSEYMDAFYWLEDQR